MQQQPISVDPKILLAPEDFVNEWREIPDDQYHSDKTAVNFSSLKKMRASPKSFHQSFFHGKNKVTDRMRFGKLAHTAMLEWDKFKANYVAMPEFGDLRVVKNKEAKKEWLAGQPKEAIICTEKERQDLLGMIESLLSHPKSHGVFKGAVVEVAGYYRDPETGIRCRFKPDLVNRGMGILGDVKTTAEACEEVFMHTIFKKDNRYDMQMGMYGDGCKNLGVNTPHRVWFAIETEAPYECYYHEADEVIDTVGYWEYRGQLRKLKECIDNNSFPRAQQEIGIITAPYYIVQNYQLRGVL